MALPSLRKIQLRLSFSVASTTFTESGFSLSVRSTVVEVTSAYFFMFTSTDARTFRWPFVSCIIREKKTRAHIQKLIKAREKNDDLTMFSNKTATAIGLIKVLKRNSNANSRKLWTKQIFASLHPAFLLFYYPYFVLQNKLFIDVEG